MKGGGGRRGGPQARHSRRRRRSKGTPGAEHANGLFQALLSICRIGRPNEATTARETQQAHTHSSTGSTSSHTSNGTQHNTTIPAHTKAHTTTYQNHSRHNTATAQRNTVLWIKRSAQTTNKLIIGCARSKLENTSEAGNTHKWRIVGWVCIRVHSFRGIEML